MDCCNEYFNLRSKEKSDKQLNIAIITRSDPATPSMEIIDHDNQVWYPEKIRRQSRIGIKLLGGGGLGAQQNYGEGMTKFFLSQIGLQMRSR